MKRIGIIGGMSYHSTLIYYKEINKRVNERVGGFTSADLILRSVNYAKYENLMQEEKWLAIAAKLAYEARTLYCSNNCDYIAIATNTMHKVGDAIDSIWYDFGSNATNSRLVHIGDCVAEKCKNTKVKSVILLGTQITMEDSFMSSRLEQNGIEVRNNLISSIVASKINYIIFEQLCKDLTPKHSKEFILDIIKETFYKYDVGGVILGSTKLGMLIKPEDCPVPIFDSTEAHIDKLVELCLSD